MKTLVHRTPLSAAPPFDLAELKLHLRVDDSEEDAAIALIGQAAAAELEHFAQLALLAQTIRVTIFEPERSSWLSLPVGPVLDGATASVTLDGEPFEGFELTGGTRPVLAWKASYFDLTPGRIAVAYEAGFGLSPEDIPRDLALAVMDQAGVLFDNRGAGDPKSFTSSPHMARIGARYRGVSA